MLGAPLGQLFASILSEVLLVAGFSLLAVIIALRMWVTATTMPEASKVVRSSHLSLDNARVFCANSVPTVNFSCVQDAWVVYCWVDFWSAYYPAYSAWAAVLIIPLLLLLSQVSMVQAVSTSLVVITLISSIGFISHLAFGEVNYLPFTSLAWLIAGGLTGMYVGQLISHRIANANLQKIFSIGLLLVAVTLFYLQTT